MLTKKLVDELFQNVNTDKCFEITESYCIEFKKNFNVANINEYIRTFSGLANNKGGYVIFGVDPDTKTIAGLTQPAIDMFPKIDEEKFRGAFKSRVEPNITFEYLLYDHIDKKFIVFRIHEAENKPVVCSINAPNNFSEGDIFFRYNDSIKKIAYSELSIILEEKRLHERNKWMDFFAKISKIGLDNLILIDGKKGSLLNPTNDSIIIDKSFIENLNYIKEGEFDEIKGKPTIKLIAQIVSNENEEALAKAILAKDIFCVMLQQRTDIDPLEFIKQSCDIQGKFPIFYYIRLSKKTISEIKDYIASVKTTKTRYKESIIARITGKVHEKPLTTDPEGKLDSPTDAMENNRKLKKHLLSEGVDNYDINNKEKMEELCKAIRTLNKEEANSIKGALLHKLHDFINNTCFDENIKSVPQYIKNAIWYLDEILFS